MNGDHGTSGDWAYSASQSNAIAIKRLEDEVKRLRVSLDDLLMALEQDGIITVIGPDDDIDAAYEMSDAEIHAAKEEEYRELQTAWESHLGRHRCYYEESDESYAPCPASVYKSFEEFYAEERAL